MKKAFYLSISIGLFFAGSGFAQTFKRQVISSLGTNHVLYQTGASSSCTSITLGQPPNAGTISSPGNILRQGFQQPVQNDCDIVAAFNIEEKNLLGCGTYYAFEYAGDVDPSTSISWQFGPNASPMIADGPAPPLVGFSQLGPQEITVTISNAHCQKSVSQFVTSNGTPFIATFSKTDAWCYGDKGSIDLTVLNSNPPVKVEWSNGKKTEDLDGLNPGEYSFSITDGKGCTTAGTVEIEGSTQPLIVLPHVFDELCTDTKDGSIEIELINANEPVTFTWADGFVGEKRESLSKGNYPVTMEDAKGCKIDTSFEIRVFCELNEADFIPDIFSPNADNFNDRWNIPMLDRFPNHVMTIYNRWGNVIWESESAFSSWDGTNSSGKEMPIGAYFYVLELNDSTDKVFKGSVTIVR